MFINIGNYPPHELNCKTFKVLKMEMGSNLNPLLSPMHKHRNKNAEGCLSIQIAIHPKPSTH